MTHSNFPSSLCFCVLSYAGAEEQQNSQTAAAVGGDGGGNPKSDNEALTLETHCYHRMNTLALDVSRKAEKDSYRKSFLT